jgi:hypothetical protein
LASRAGLKDFKDETGIERSAAIAYFAARCVDALARREFAMQYPARSPALVDAMLDLTSPPSNPPALLPPNGFAKF